MASCSVCLCLDASAIFSRAPRLKVNYAESYTHAQEIRTRCLPSCVFLLKVGRSSDLAFSWCLVEFETLKGKWQA